LRRHGLLLIGVLSGALLCAAYVSRYDSLSLGERARFDPTSFNLRGLFLAQLAIGVLGVLVISSEYTTGMIRTSFAAVPQRRTVVAAKSVVFLVVAFVVGTDPAKLAASVQEAIAGTGAKAEPDSTILEDVFIRLMAETADNYADQSAAGHPS